MCNRPVLMLTAVFLGLTLHAQDSRMHAPLQKIDSSGFYSIMIDPRLGAGLHTDLRDLRIMENSRQVPYIKGELIKGQANYFEVLPVTKRSSDTAGTTLILDAKNRSLSEIALVISNTAAERTASLSGSNDEAHWFIIHEDLHLNNSGMNAQGRYVQSLEFPYSQYRYYKLRIRNEGSDPLNVIAAGYYLPAETDKERRFILHEGTKFIQKDSITVSRIIIENSSPFVVNKIDLSIAAPPLYHRQGRIYLSDVYGSKGNWLNSFILDPDTHSITVPGVHARYLLIEIDNGDNPPLQISKVQTLQRPQQLITWLEKEKDYQLVAIDPPAAAPVYDLEQFRDRLPALIPSLTYGPVETTVMVKDESISRNWLWPAIIGMILVLGLLTYRLTGEMRKKGM